MKKIKIFKASSFAYTPFDDFESGDHKYLNERGISLVCSAKQADVIVSQNLKHLKKYFPLRFKNKKFLIWTLEPKFDTSFKSLISKYFGLVNIHIMNVYTGDILINNIATYAKKIDKNLNYLDEKFRLSNRKVVALMSHYKGLRTEKLMKNNRNIDLIALRTKIALDGHEKNCVDIFGKGWPKGFSKENSRTGNWKLRKKEIMQPYYFNLCFENTATAHYMTEKIWDSIENYCLPIYYAANTQAYETFPKDSFIDYSKFKTPSELFEFIDNMTNKEYVKRINKCIDVYKSISKQSSALHRENRKLILDNIVNKLVEISPK